ncbi:MAG: 30S ribosomal protein S20 [Verrucomicrobiae bacterium]|nr:30S ribosomal protein S20 [Verrucomicrobiae bacterium]
MPNTLSAERRMRKSERRHMKNHAVKSRLKTIEKKFNTLLKENKVEEAKKFLSTVYSAFDKAVKYGVVKRGTADRKKSRIAERLAKTAPSKAVAK